jgi:thiol-disulfide isomerase/thioredoxin
MNVDLSQIRRKTASVIDYVDGVEEQFREKFLERKRTYQLHQETVNQLRKYAGRYVVIAFSASWCKDCATNIPVLARINEASGIEVRVFGGLKKDPLDHTRKWRVPPSPSEVYVLNVDKIPLIIIVDTYGREIGRIVENPKRRPTLEQELLDVIESPE